MREISVRVRFYYPWRQFSITVEVIKVLEDVFVLRESHAARCLHLDVQLGSGSGF